MSDDGTAAGGAGLSAAALRLARLLEAAIVWVSKSLLVVMTLVLFGAIFMNVVLRYAFSSGVAGAYELPAILFPWLVISGAVLAAQRGQHIAVDLILRVGPARLRHAVRLLIDLLIAAMALVVVQAGWSMMVNSWGSRLAETGLSEGWGYLALVYGYAAIGLVALISLCRRLLEPSAGATADDARQRAPMTRP